MTRIDFDPGAGQANLTERQFMNQVIDLAVMLGWKVHHETFSMGTKPGWPDLTLCHDAHGLLFLELKGPRGRTTDAQVEWIEALRRAGQRAYIVRPTDIAWIAELLQGNDTRERSA